MIEVSDYSLAEKGLLESILAGQMQVANRSTLGSDVPIKLFQVMRLIAFGSGLEAMVGSGARRALVYQSGQRVGQFLGGAVLAKSGRNLSDYLKGIRELCVALSMGLLVLERSDSPKNRLVLRVDECVSCAGIVGAKAPICDFETGMVGGLVRSFVSTDRPRDVKAVETKCNAVGDRTCAIDVEVLS